ncbi:MAG: hypothetical protein ABJA98_09440 [Acidobacteriota bacterium]
MTWLIAQRRSAEASEIVWGLVMFWLVRGHAAEGLRWHEQVLRVPLPTPLVEARLLIGSSLMLYRFAAERHRCAPDPIALPWPGRNNRPLLVISPHHS